jgi:hypothetical protein
MSLVTLKNDSCFVMLKYLKISHEILLDKYQFYQSRQHNHKHHRNGNGTDASHGVSFYCSYVSCSFTKDFAQFSLIVCRPKGLREPPSLYPDEICLDWSLGNCIYSFLTDQEDMFR